MFVFFPCVQARRCRLNSCGLCLNKTKHFRFKTKRSYSNSTRWPCFNWMECSFSSSTGRKSSSAHVPHNVTTRDRCTSTKWGFPLYASQTRCLTLLIMRIRLSRNTDARLRICVDFRSHRDKAHRPTKDVKWKYLYFFYNVTQQLERRFLNSTVTLISIVSLPSSGEMESALTFI